MRPRAAYFQTRGHNFLLHGPTLSQHIKCFFSWTELIFQITNVFVYESEL